MSGRRYKMVRLSPKAHRLIMDQRGFGGRRTCDDVVRFFIPPVPKRKP